MLFVYCCFLAGTVADGSQTFSLEDKFWSTPNQCTAHSVYYAANFNDVAVTEKQVEALIPSDGFPKSLDLVVSALKRLGISAQRFYSEELPADPAHRYVATVELSEGDLHFVYVHGSTDEKVVIVDGSAGTRAISRKVFAKIWTGFGVSINSEPPTARNRNWVRPLFVAVLCLATLGYVVFPGKNSQ